jgi:hypothetical protein
MTYAATTTVAPEPAALPCPFCGAFATIEYWHGGTKRKRLISCSNTAGTLGNPRDATCWVGPSVTGETRAQALRRWNRRVSP